MRIRILKKIAARAALSMPLLISATALAWNETGHRIIAHIAWDELTPAQQTFAVDLLSKHPRFAEDFEGQMPDGIKALPATDPEKGRWLFAQAAVWPDLVKDEAKRVAKQLAETNSAEQKSDLENQLGEYKLYDNSAWHYDNKPIYLDPYALPPPLGTGSSQRPMGIQQALPKALKEFYDPSLSPAKRAVALAWVAHLVGDAHQPLHSAAMFSAKYLPQGDLGGNKTVVKLKQPPGSPISLHQLWDDLFGGDPKKEESTKNAVVAAFPREQLQQELAGPGPTTPSAEESSTNLWMDESYRAADKSVYNASLRNALLTPPPEGAASPFPIPIGDDYLRDANAVATRRAALAGYRLADCISKAESRKKP